MENSWVSQKRNWQNITKKRIVGRPYLVKRLSSMVDCPRTENCLVFKGNVYNITPYLDFHPGGVDEIMKGAGIDATKLFQEIHAWVRKGKRSISITAENCLGEFCIDAGKMSGGSIDQQDSSKRSDHSPKQTDTHSTSIRFSSNRDEESTIIYLHHMCHTDQRQSLYAFGRFEETDCPSVHWWICSYHSYR